MKWNPRIVARKTPRRLIWAVLGIVNLQIFISPARAEPLDGSELLEKSQTVLSQLPPLPHLTYRQQVDVKGKQTYRSTLDVLLRQDGSWQTWIMDGEHIRWIESESLDFVTREFQFGWGGSDPSRPVETQRAEQVDLVLVPDPETYTVKSASLVSLQEQPAYHLILGGTGQLQELWLDPESFIPHRMHLAVSEDWGEAQVQIDLQLIEKHVLPSRITIDATYDFRALWVKYNGRLQIQHQFQNYQLLPTTERPAFFPERPPLDGSPEIMGLSTELPGPDDSITRFNLNLGQSSQDSPIDQQIAEFNLNRPQIRETLDHLLILTDLRLQQQSFPLYVIEVETDKL